MTDRARRPPLAVSEPAVAFATLRHARVGGRSPGIRCSRPAIAAIAVIAFALSSSCASSPSSVQAREWLAIGNAWAEKGEWARAGTAWSRAIELNPKLTGASYNMVRSLAESGDYEKAIAAADSLLTQDPSNVRVLSLKAYSLARSGRNDEALSVYEKVVAQDPLSPDAVYNAALLKSLTGRMDQAIADLAKLFEALPDDYQSAALYGRLCDESGDDATALTVYESLAKAGKADSAILIRMGAMYESRGNFSRAMDVLTAGTSGAQIPQPAAAGSQPGSVASQGSASPSAQTGQNAPDSAAQASGPVQAAKQARLAKALFSLARLRLAVAEDGPGGLAALDKAIALGFADRGAAEELMLLPVLAKRDEVLLRLKNAKILP